MDAVKAGRREAGFWAVAALLLVSNTALSYFPLPYGLKGCLVFGGVLVPFLLLSLHKPPIAAPLGAGPVEKGWSEVPWVLIAVLSALGALLRFARLSQISLWPTGDEALNGFLAIALAHKWSWQFFYSVGELPPLLTWMLAALFKGPASSFFNLWFLPALFSTLWVPLGYFLAQGFYSKGFSLLLAFLMAFSFWPLAAGRFCHQGFLIPFWEMVALVGLRFWMKPVSTPSNRNGAVFLGVWTGIGSLTFAAWWVDLFLLAMTVLALYRKGALKNASWFFASLFAGLSPFLAAAWKEGYGHHFMDSSIAAHRFSPAHQWVTHLSYLTSLFWGPLEPDASYGPCWGGMLNPVLATCFLLGLAELWSNRRRGFHLWLLFALAVCVAPAFWVGDYVEMNRVIQVMPFLLWTALLGLKRVVGEIRRPVFRGGVLVALLSASTVLDLNHYFMPFYRHWASPFHPGPATLNENYRAYQILDEAYRKKGPGILLAGFLPLGYGHSLYVTTEPFNAADNPRFQASQAAWACLATNVDYVPFLSSRLPGARWYWLGSGMPGAEGGLSIGWVPITPSNRNLLERWREADALFHQLSLEAERAFNGPKAYQQALQDTFKVYPSVRGDPFLESCYWEWVSQFQFDAAYGRNAQALGLALQRGYPAAHLYQRLSEILAAQEKAEESQEAHEAALRNLPRFHLGPRGEMEDLDSAGTRR